MAYVVMVMEIMTIRMKVITRITNKPLYFMISIVPPIALTNFNEADDITLKVRCNL